MRRFSSYGPIDTDEHYYAPREELIDSAYTRLVGENPAKGGHYITVWAPRQTGKTWVMQEVVEKLKKTTSYSCAIFSMESVKKSKSKKKVLDKFTEKMTQFFQVEFPKIDEFGQLPSLFTRSYFKEPVILIIDEFDALEEKFINDFVSIFRDIYLDRSNERNKQDGEKTYLLHGLALVGVRSVLGIENIKGSPFNVQQSAHISNLTYDEVSGMFRWYEKESGQKVEQEVIDKLYYETNGQPGLTCWFGELLTGTYNEQKNQPVTIMNFDKAYAAATSILPNNNILNIISKADKSPYNQLVLELFKTDLKTPFKYDNKNINYLYMNGVIDLETESKDQYYVKFSCPFVQKRLFNYFSTELFHYMGQLYEPMENLDDIVTETQLNIKNLARLYQKYLKKNREWLFKDVPRRVDMRIFEAVYHFNFYSYLNEFLRNFKGRVFPEFPTGNGKIDLFVTFDKNRYGIELKSYSDEWNYKKALDRAAKYGRQLGLDELYLIFFVEYFDDKSREKYETDFTEKESNVTVKPIFIETGI